MAEETNTNSARQRTRTDTEPLSGSEMVATVDRFLVNDELTALAEHFGARLTDGELNELTHHVADLFDRSISEARS